jgi:hypothetical protein
MYLIPPSPVLTMPVLKVKVREGALELDNEKLVVRKTFESGIMDNIITRVSNYLAKKEDAIPLKDITRVIVESGSPGNICPQIIVLYGKKSRLIEFCLEDKPVKRSDLRKVLDFFEKKGIELGFTVEA